MPIDFFSKKKLSTFSAVSRWNDVAEKSEAEKRSPEGIHSQVISVGKEPWKKPPTENFIVSFFWKGIKKQPPSTITITLLLLYATTVYATTVPCNFTIQYTYIQLYTEANSQ